MKKIIQPIAFLLLLLCACKSSSTTQQRFKVEHRGALMNIMHKGDISAQANLSDLAEKDHVFALGAVKNLKGEILILDGKPYISSVKDGKLHIDNSFDHEATLLVYAGVSSWNPTKVPDNVGTYEELENHVQLQARKSGINTDEPFPFLLEGKADSFDWHVIDWKEGDKEHSHEKHINSGLNGTLTDREVQILGFYSNKHHAVFTHHTTNMHLHVRTTDGEIAGHVDGLKLGEGMLLKLPGSK